MGGLCQKPLTVLSNPNYSVKKIATSAPIKTELWSKVDGLSLCTTFFFDMVYGSLLCVWLLSLILVSSKPSEMSPFAVHPATLKEALN